MKRRLINFENDEIPLVVIPQFEEKVKRSQAHYKKALENVTSIRALYNQQLFDQAIDNAYHAIFQAMQALITLAGYQVISKHHNDVWTIFKSMFVDQALGDQDLATFFNQNGMISEEFYEEARFIREIRDYIRYEPEANANSAITEEIICRSTQIYEKLLKYRNELEHFLSSKIATNLRS
ncbi:HEPN domain-containing protein [Candidatus Bathyarchaeota archaeon]|nr:HEPN domain-containing protein [Candidatus Bathyarchaeota archaeon]